MFQRHINERALAVSRRALGLVKSLLREEEWRDFTDEMYDIARQEFEAFVRAAQQEGRRLRPMGDESCSP